VSTKFRKRQTVPLQPNYRKISCQITEKYRAKLPKNIFSHYESANYKQIQKKRMKSPSFKMVLTATGQYAYRRPGDGVYVVPIGCIKP
jgi:hypothetical protein